MKRKMNKIITILTGVSIMIGTLVSPGLVASATEIGKDNYANNAVYEQKLKELEVVKESLKDIPDINVKVNEENMIEIYNNEVAKINEKAAMSGGLVYGVWFGGADSYYSMSPSETIKLGVFMASAIIPFLSSEIIAVQAASSITGMIGTALEVKPGQWIRADRSKRYREVTYSDGSFAYFQTRIGASVTRSDTYLGSGYTVISGGMW